MEVKKDILWRVYLSFIGIAVFGVVIIGRAVYIQQVQGDTWREMAKEQQQKIFDIKAERGSIYSEDGSMLSTSIPYYDIYIDFAADGLRQKGGKIFKDNVDSLCYYMAAFFKDKSAAEYKKPMLVGYKKKNRYFLLRKNISFREYQEIKKFPLLKLDPNKGGMIVQANSKRLMPFGLLANRTIGLSRAFVDSNGETRTMNVGLEYTYDSVLKGEGGKRLMQKLSPGVYVPVEGSEIEPEHGKDIITTINVNIQDIAEQALYSVLKENECEYGTCIVMEVATGKIKAMANLGRTSKGDYTEDLNYAIRTSEPGSTFKLATMLALLEDKQINLNSTVDLEGGQWKVGGRTVFDSEEHGLRVVTMKKAFMASSNVAMAKMAVAHYTKDPIQFIDHLKRLRLHEYSGVDLKGETPPIIKTPKSRTWSATSLPWMAFGYEVAVSPLQTLMLYNAVANRGTMMKPYLVSAIQKNGETVQQFEPEVLVDKIASEQTIQLLKESLNGVCNEEGGTGYKLFLGAPYKVAGKTGTALMANGNKGYSEHIYQSSFAGYFPADAPKYSCIVVVRNKPFAKKYYGAAVAGPVFKTLADKLYALDAGYKDNPFQMPAKKDSSTYLFAGATDELSLVAKTLGLNWLDSSQAQSWGRFYALEGKSVLRGQELDKQKMPDVRGMGLKDALFLLETVGLKVTVKGRGKVVQQSVAPGTTILKQQVVQLELN
ncbi:MULTISPECIES: penicillin-binding protein [unclassified Paraflavitalea]|uniref:penicillin-binding protein n=1 Tax=unclassified Paraflavitalea TaxID=2798305 RepID=UPI003D33AE07